MKELRPFFTPFYTDMLYIEDSVVEEVRKMRNTDKGVLLSNAGGWHSSFYQSIENPIISPLVDDIMFKMKRVYSEYGISKDPAINNLFFTVNKRYNYTVSHNHPFSYFGVVLYLRVPRNSGAIVFDRPDPSPAWIEVDEYNDRNRPVFKVQPKAGALIIFPSYMRHSVEQNVTDEYDDERITMVMNIK